MPDLYNVNNWATATLYEKNTIVLNNGFYYYAKDRHTSGTFATDLSNGLWGGTIQINGQTKPFFFWQLSYNYSLQIEPKVKIISFGDNYEQRLGDGINNILLPFDIEFNDRDLAEYTAILHFLHTRAGFGEFYFIPPVPFNMTKKFICPKWSPTQIDYNKYNITAIFQEKV